MGAHPGTNGLLGKECLSQWYPAPFIVRDERYATAEHYMMVQKARLFGDADAARRIFDTAHPSDAKRLGRGVLGFDDVRWREHRFEIVVAASYAKFSQHEELGAFLLATGDRVIVEASPRDTIWGIGLGQTNAAAGDPTRWRGLNLLGFALMKARAQLRR